MLGQCLQQQRFRIGDSNHSSKSSVAPALAAAAALETNCTKEKLCAPPPPRASARQRHLHTQSHSQHSGKSPWCVSSVFGPDCPHQRRRW